MKLNEQQINYLAIQAKSSPHKHGYLHKKSGKKNTLPDHATVRWQKRWCVVYYNMLFYFEDQATMKPQGVIFLEETKTQTAFTVDRNLFCFAIGIPSNAHRQYLFGCESLDERQSWMKAILATTGDNLFKENKDTRLKVHELEQQIDILREEKEKLRQELSNQWSQIARLKLELSSIRERDIKPRCLHENFRKTDVSHGSLELIHGTQKLTGSEISKIIKLQAFIRVWLVRRKWEKLVKPFVAKFTFEKLIQRNRLLSQFVAAEEDYVSQMNVLVNTFLNPLKTLSYSRQGWLSKGEVAKIFSTSEALLVLHQIFVKGMDERMKNWPAVQIDDLLVAVITVVPIYVEYIKNLPDSLKILAECKKRPEFVQNLKLLETKADCNGQTLEQFLNYPVRVIPTYIRNIHDILEVTPEEHYEKKSLEIILQRLHEAQSYNHVLDEGENIRQILEIERLIEGGCHLLLNADQKFVRHGVLKQLCLDTSYGFGKKEKLRHCFLFSHHLLVASRTAEGRLRLSKNFGAIPLQHALLNEEVVNPAYPEHKCSRAFILTFDKVKDKNGTNSGLVMLMAAKPNEKALWTSDISQCIDNLALEEEGDVSVNDEDADKNESLVEGEDKFEANTCDVFNEHVGDDNRLRDNASDIKYGNEFVGPYHLPQIMHASIDRLIERLSDPRLPDFDFMETFLLTYRAFTTSKAVLEGLIDAYWKVMGGKPPQPKPDSPDRKKLAVNRTSSGRSRVRSVLSNSSFSSIDDLDASFNSSASPYNSTTVFNYNTLKEQLNSPTKRSAATTKWCQDAAEVNKENKPHSARRPRSASACNVLVDTTNTNQNRRLSRSQSVEVIIRKTSAGEMNGDRCVPFSKCLSGEELDNHCDCESTSRIVAVSQSDKINDCQQETCENSLFTDDKPYSNIHQEQIPLDNVNQALQEQTVDNNLLAADEQNVANDVDSVGSDLMVNDSFPVGEIEDLTHCDSTGSLLDVELSSNVGSLELERTSTMETVSSSTDLDRRSTMESFRSESCSLRSTPDVDRRATVLSASQSDELICKKRTVSDSIPIAGTATATATARSLDQNNVDMHKRGLSPYFLRKKKDKSKKEKSRKSRSSSEPQNDIPVLLNMTNRRTGEVFKRSVSQYEPRNDYEHLEESENTSHSLDRRLITSSSSLPIAMPIPKISVRKPSEDGPKRKRSIFSPFKKGGIKRASSEQALSLTDMHRESLNCNLSNSLMSLDEKPSRKQSVGSVGSFREQDEERMSVNETSPLQDDLNTPIKSHSSRLHFKSLRGDITFGRKKKSTLTPPPSKESSNLPPRRKTSVFEAGRAPITLRKSVSANRGPLKIMSIFKHWLAKHPKDFVEDPEMIALLEGFFADIKSDSRTFSFVKEIVGGLERSLTAHRKSLSAIHPFDELLLQQYSLGGTVNTTDINCNPTTLELKPLQKYSCNVVAENMTLLEHYLYAKISFNEFVCCQWTKKDKHQKAAGIMKFIKRFNQVTKIISYNVVHGVTSRDRASLIEFWIRVAAHCRDLNNFNAIMEIISALNASSVYRLKKSWDQVSKPVREVFSDLEALVSADRSFKNLREAVHMCNPPCVPYLGCYLSDLLFVHDGGKTFNDDGLINYAKMCRISRLVREIKCYQQLPYTLELNLEVARALVNFNKEVDEDSLYEQSLLAEPRGN